MRRSGRHDAHLLGSRSRTTTDEPPRRSTWSRVLDQLPERRTNTRPPRGSPSDPAHDHQVTRPAAASQATLGAAARVPDAEPLKTSTHHNAREVFRGSLLPKTFY